MIINDSSDHLKIDIDRIAFDIDGVVADVVTPFLRILEERYGYHRHTPEEVLSFDLAQVLGIPDAVYSDVLDIILESPLEAGVEPYPGALDILSRLIERTPLLFVTSRPTPEPMTAWFESAFPGLPSSRIRIVATGDPMDKLKPLRENGKTAFVDDHPATCRQLRQAGIEALVFDQPWNRRDQDLPRIRGWEELAALF